MNDTNYFLKSVIIIFFINLIVLYIYQEYYMKKEEPTIVNNIVEHDSDNMQKFKQCIGLDNSVKLGNKRRILGPQPFSHQKI